MKKNYYLMVLGVLFIVMYGCKKDSGNTLNNDKSPELSLKAAFDQQYAKSNFKSQERSFNENFRTEILWDNVTFKTPDTAIVKVKLLEDVKIYTNDSIPVNMSDNLVVKATKNMEGDWVFVKVMYLPEYGKDLPAGFTGRIMSEGYFDKNYLVTKYLGGHAYFVTFNSVNPWIDYKNSPKMKAGLPGDPRCTEEEGDGETVYAYVNGELNSIWYRPPSPTPPVCVDDPILDGGGGTGGGGGSPSDVMDENTPSEEIGEIKIDGCPSTLDAPDQKDPQQGDPKKVAKIDWRYKTKRGTIVTDWTDNTGRKHTHFKMDTYYSGFFKSFTTDLLNIGTGVSVIFDMFKSGKVFVPPTSWGAFYGTEAKYIVEEMQEYNNAKKLENEKNGTKCKP